MKTMRLITLALVLQVCLPLLAHADESKTDPAAGGQPSTTVQGRSMKFLMTFTLRGDKQMRDEAFARFRKTRGEPPKGVKFLGRLTTLDFGKVYVLVETQDAKALAQYAFEWGDVTQVHTVPVMGDAELVDILERGSQ